MADESKKTKSTTSHLYDGKTVRSSAPSRKKAAGRMKGNTEIPKDAIPEVHVPSVIESFFGGPIVSKTKFLPPDNMVTSLQMGAAIVLVVLSAITFMVTPVSGTAWFWITNYFGLAFVGGLIHLVLIAIGLIGGIYGIYQRDQRAIIVSYVIMIIVTLRFAGSKVEFGVDLLPDNEIAQKLLLILYALSLVMYIELTSGIIRFSMLDTSIRTGEVYVMNVTKITSRYHKALAITPTIAGFVALITLLINFIVPFMVGIFDSEAAERLRESVELTSVYGVALGTAVVFLIIAAAFGANIPKRVAQMREK
ncbi:MAG: hypothetical protein HN534_00685 [Euryarchaeota archaeon]|jgi:hypothetical protein|nr:hypothetical protein [Euryarchaeota archaeon]MBT3653438.1 hypothetical protein [Euryarchaeota archaeon]MBT3758306.1 hypothetical protein [Euryarchaeota archaeon]MBT4051415.1 hypothetical protein [Euryarchaeota archaeon]MBT4346698.1 hypothetical protein [Euryarchaeota archaeon]